jgi:hypothetical protein
MDFQLQYLLPVGLEAAPPGYDRSIMQLGASLRGADTDGGAAIPNTPLTIRMNLMLNGAGIDLLYNGKLAYINFCCFERKHSHSVYKAVEAHYKRYKLGFPRKPTMPNWIHLIPVNGPIPEREYSLFSQKLTVAFYWAAFAQITKGKRNI